MATAGVVKGTDGRVLLGCNFTYNNAVATITGGGTKINADTWRISGKADDIPAVGFEDVAYDGNVYDAGSTSMIYSDIAFSGYWDILQNPHANPPNIKQGSVIGTSTPLTAASGGGTGVGVYISKNNNKYYTFQGLRILGCDTGGNLKTRVDLNVQAKSSGNIWWPN